jgi:predicted phosphodiesterase
MPVSGKGNQPQEEEEEVVRGEGTALSVILRAVQFNKFLKEEKYFSNVLQYFFFSKNPPRSKILRGAIPLRKSFHFLVCTRTMNPTRALERLTVNVACSEPITMLVLSDTHCLDTEEFYESLPPADILLHCGDFSNMAEGVHDLVPSCEHIKRVAHRYNKVIVIVGNHEIVKNQVSQEDLLGLLPEFYVRQGLVSYKDLNIYLVSFPEDAVLNNFIAPEAVVQVFVTHVAAAGSPGEGRRNVGSPNILRARTILQPAIHIFGHAHGRRGLYGAEPGSSLVEVNASMYDDESSLRPPYFITFNPILVVL